MCSMFCCRPKTAYAFRLSLVGSERCIRYRFEVYMVDSSRDGIEQISDVLSGGDSLDEVHIISHGTDGYIDIGATRLDVQML